jgi:hypothetical protein
MSRVILVAGTHSWDGDGRIDWYMPSSNFASYLATQGVQPVFGDGHPFTWSTRLGGVGFGSSDLVEWHAAGVNLLNYIVPPLCPEKRIPAVETNLIVHSHGLQVALFACASGLQVNTLISVGSPVRKDMETIARAARPNITRWLHLHSDGSDRWQWIGELFDGRFGIVRKNPLADANDFVSKVGHSDLLRNPEHFHLWAERDWLDWLQPAERSAA